jgi:hypothetical protein
MAWIFASWLYIMSTPSVVSRGAVLKGLATVASAWPPLAAGRGSHFVGLSLSGGEEHHQDPLFLESGLMLRPCEQLGHSNGLLADELASPLCYLFLSGGLSSTDLRLLTPMTSAMSHEREVGVRLWHRCPRWNHRCGLSGRSILHPSCGHDGSMRSPYAAPPRRGEAKGPSST